MAGPIKISLIANGRQARAELQRTGAAGSAMGRRLSSAGKLIAGAFAVTEIARAGSAFVRVGNQYTSELAKINALTTAQQRAQVGGISGVAKTLEKNRAQYAKYGSTVGDAAAGVTELVKAGQSLPHSLREINATMVLAKAGEMSVADASSLVATSLTAFHLKARDAGKVANDLANAANISTADVSDLGEALKFVAPIAGSAGISIRDTTAYLAELSNAGINGSLAGTGLRKVMQSLQAPTGIAGKAIKKIGLQVFDASGKARPFATVLQDLQKKMDGLSDKAKKQTLRKIFGLTGVTSATVLLDNVNALDKYRKGIDRAGAAAKLARANSAGLVGALKELKANAVSAAQGFYRDFSPKVEKALRDAMSWFDKNKSAISDGLTRAFDRVKPVLSDLATALEDTGKIVKEIGQQDWPVFADAVKATLSVFDGILKAFNAIPGPVKTFAANVGVAALSLAAFKAALKSVTTSAFASSLTGASVSLRVLRAELADTATRATAMRTIWGGLSSTLKQAAGIGGMLALTKGLQGATKAGGTFGDVMAGAAGGAGIGAMFGPVGALVGAGVGGGLTGLIAAFHRTKTASEQTRVELARKAGFAEAQKDAKTLSNALQGVINKYNGAVEAAVRKSFIGKNGQLDSDVKTLRNYGVSMQTITEAALGNRQAISVVSQAFDQNRASLKSNLDVTKQYYDSIKNGGTELKNVAGVMTRVPIDPSEIKAAKTAYDDAKKSLDNLNVAQGTFKQRITDSGSAWQAQVQKVRETAAAVGLTVKQFKALPQKTRFALETPGLIQTGKQALDVITKFKTLQNFKSIKTILSAKNVDATIKQVNTLAKKYDLTPKQVKTLIQLEGLDKARKGLTNLEKDGGKAGSTTASNYANGVRHGSGAATAAGRSVAGSALSGMRSNAGGASGVGADMAQGLANGLYSRADAIVRAAGSLVQRGMAAMRHEADSHSPSRKTYALGQDMVYGFALGMGRDKPAANAGRSMIATVIAAIKGGTDGLSKQFDKIYATIQSGLEKRLKNIDQIRDKHSKGATKAQKKHWDKWAKEHEKAAKKNAKTDTQAVKATQKSLNLIAKAYEKNDAKLKSLQSKRADMISSVQSSIRGELDLGSLVDTSAFSPSKVSFTSVAATVHGLATRARKVISLMRRALKGGIPKGLVQEVLALGTTQAIPVFQALLSGSKSQRRSLASDFGQINSLSTTAGTVLGNAFYASGIAAQQGLLKGLLDKKALKSAASKLAGVLTKEVKRALGIHSPSRVFRDIGSNVVAGLQIGLDETYVKRQGATLAASLQKGFAQPELSAVASYTGSGPQDPVAVLTAEVAALRKEVRQGNADRNSNHEQQQSTLAAQPAVFATVLNGTASSGMRRQSKHAAARWNGKGV